MSSVKNFCAAGESSIAHPENTASRTLRRFLQEGDVAAGVGDLVETRLFLKADAVH